ncbi:TadE/TadG family type IV pilus assembly protein [Salirhabdus salicampi]|uniref:TadE/TadG family type IV pilus assembly protein n=1 Tax=Salirhabdus salicampi TaxID=476102 RepID=UPI0020C4EEA2|nr:TadE family protein [Salirhabdus salicampi]MCP8616131.1 pilus assembly protein [Salirhabdus salicampi]
MKRSERGQATVELALTITILLFIVFGMIDFGRIFNVYLTLEHSTREGARIASIGAENTEIYQRVRNAAGNLDADQMNISISPDSNRTRGSYVTISVSYPVSISTPIIQEIVPNPYIVKTETTMRME